MATNVEYTVSTKGGEAFAVRAGSYGGAAEKAARLLCGRKRGLVARRTTGEPGKSGWFRAYYPDRKVNALNSTGEPFHVS